MHATEQHRRRPAFSNDRPIRSNPTLPNWLRRYGLPELAGTLTAVITVSLVAPAAGSTVAAAYAGALGEGIVYYSIIFARDFTHVWSPPMTARVGALRSLPVLRGMLIEFGPAELLDLLVVRPLCLAAGIHWLGSSYGAFAGKLLADLAFYGPVLAMHELRRIQPSRGVR